MLVFVLIMMLLLTNTDISKWIPPDLIKFNYKNDFYIYSAHKVQCQTILIHNLYTVKGVGHPLRITKKLCYNCIVFLHKRFNECALTF